MTYYVVSTFIGLVAGYAIGRFHGFKSGAKSNNVFEKQDLTKDEWRRL